MSSILFRMHDFKTVFLRKHVEYTAGGVKNTIKIYHKNKL